MIPGLFNFSTRWPRVKPGCNVRFIGTGPRQLTSETENWGIADKQSQQWGQGSAPHTAF